VTKLLSRWWDHDDEEAGGSAFTNAIDSDALTQLAAIFSALIHDVDHWVFRMLSLLRRLQLPSCMEEMLPRRTRLPAGAWANSAGCKLASVNSKDSMLVIGAVMAADIVDKDLKERRNARWEAVFCETAQKRQEKTMSHESYYRLESYTGGRCVPHDAALASIANGTSASSLKIGRR
jgi:hypothetical protein